MRKKIMVALSVLLGLFAPLAITTPAQAQPAGCIAGQGCFYTGANYSGSVTNRAWSIYGSGMCFNLPSQNDSSVWNDYGSNMRLFVYTNTWCSGTERIIYAKSGLPNFEARSFKIRPF